METGTGMGIGVPVDEVVCEALSGVRIGSVRCMLQGFHDGMHQLLHWGCPGRWLSTRIFITGCRMSMMMNRVCSHSQG